MGQRHTLVAGDWSRVAGRLEELVSAGCGEPPLDVVVELLAVCLWAERHARPRATAAAVRALRASARQDWPELLTLDSLSRVPDGVLGACLDALGPLRLDAAHGTALDAVFEGLTSRRRRGDKGQFLTPRPVCRALSGLLRLTDADTVLDPACGSGGLLAAAGQWAPGARLVGMDLDPGALRVARLLATLSDRAVTLHHGDALRPDALPSGAFDVVVSNPPFAGDLQDASVLQHFETPALSRPERDLLFVERCIQLLRPGGRLGLVLPAGRLSSSRQAGWRDWLLRRLRLEVVVSLAAAAFQPHTAQRTALLVGVRRPEPLDAAAPLPEEPVCFAASERAGRDRRGRPVLRPAAAADGAPWDVHDHDLDAVLELVAEARRAPWPG